MAERSIRTQDTTTDLCPFRLFLRFSLWPISTATLHAASRYHAKPFHEDWPTMLDRIIQFSLRNRLLILVAAAIMLGVGTWQTSRLSD